MNIEMQDGSVNEKLWFYISVTFVVFYISFVPFSFFFVYTSKEKLKS